MGFLIVRISVLILVFFLQCKIMLATIKIIMRKCEDKHKRFASF